MEKDIGTLIRESRLEKKLSRRDLAIQCNIGFSTLCFIETGRIKQPRLETLVLLSKLLDLEKLKETCGYVVSEIDAMNGATLIKSARLQHNLSRDELANQCRLNPHTIFSLESGKTKQPHLKTLEVLSINLNIDLDVLKEKYGYV